MDASTIGGLNLTQLIASMSPTLHPETYVFAHIPYSSSSSETATSNMLQPALPRLDMLFREVEGWTIIATQAVATELKLNAIFPCRKITLNVHSSLEASGVIAAVATRLAKLGMGVNPVSGYFHDHLFVPVGKEVVALDELRRMAKEQS